MAVLKSIMHEATVRPRVGWVRADQARSQDDLKREIELRDTLKEALAEIEKLERELRDRAILSQEVARDQLSRAQMFLTSP